MKYFAAYRCPLCGKRLRLGDSVEVPHDELPKLLGQVIRNQSFAGNPYLYQAPLYVPCKCNDGNAGLAQFIGFVKDEEKDRSAVSFLNRIVGNKDL